VSAGTAAAGRRHPGTATVGATAASVTRDRGARQRRRHAGGLHRRLGHPGARPPGHDTSAQPLTSVDAVEFERSSDPMAGWALRIGLALVIASGAFLALLQLSPRQADADVIVAASVRHLDAGPTAAPTPARTPAIAQRGSGQTRPHHGGRR
jgi:hypothetical protein